MDRIRRVIFASEAPPRTKPSNYPAEFAQRMTNRLKRPLSDMFGLTNLGVNLTTLGPGAVSSLHHRHSEQDEFIFVLQGKPTLFVDNEDFELRPGMCAGFRAKGPAHHLENRTSDDVVILEMGDRAPGDSVFYPDDDIEAVLKDGSWAFARKDGSPFTE